MYVSTPAAGFKISSIFLPKTALHVRICTLLLLSASLVVLVTNTVKVTIQDQEAEYRYKSVYSYRYVLYASVIGLAYTLLQIPFALFHAMAGNPIINHVSIFYFNFIGDKLLLCLLATGVGAAYGASVDLKRSVDESIKLNKIVGGNSILSELQPKQEHFLGVGLVSATLLLFAFLGSGVSSTISSLALSKRHH